MRVEVGAGGWRLEFAKLPPVHWLAALLEAST